MDVSAPHPDESANRSPDRLIGISIRHQMLILFTIALGIVFCWFLRFSARLTDDHMENRLRGIAEMTAAGIDGDMHQSLSESDDPVSRSLEDKRHLEIVEWLNLVQGAYSMVKVEDGQDGQGIRSYTYVETEEPGVLEFVISTRADDPELGGAELRESYRSPSQAMQDGLTRTAVSIETLVKDRWGTWISGYAPIYNSQGQAVAAVGVDMRDDVMEALRRSIRHTVLPPLAIACAVLFSATLLISHVISHPLVKLARSAEQAVWAGSGDGTAIDARGRVRNEISTLTEAFGRMAAKAHEREVELSSTKDRYRALVDSLPGAPFLVDGTASVSYVSPRIEPLLGYSPDEWLSEDGRFWLGLFHPDDRDRFPQTADLTAAPPRTWQFDARLRHKDGTHRWARIGLTSWLDGSSVLCSGVLCDMDAARRDQEQLQSYAAALRSAHQELRDTQAQLLQSAKVATVGELAASTAHELNNPLAAIRGLAQVLITKRSDDTELQETLNQIIVDTDRMTRTVRRLHGLARQTPAEPTLVSINQVLEAALSRLSTQLDRHKIELEQAFDPDVPLVHGIAQQLEQVAINLLTNARDAMVQKEMPGRITLRTWHDSTNRRVIFSVADTGVGIAPEHRADIFSPFFTTKPAGRGTGLGLSTSLRIVQEHRGNIVFDSQPGKGTVFTVLLPAGPPAKP